jgi:hypothetical protein
LGDSGSDWRQWFALRSNLHAELVRPEAIDQVQLRADKHAAVALIESISRQLNQGQPAEVAIEIEQLGRWITARNELALDWVPRLDGVNQPVVIGIGERLRIGVARRWGGWRFVLSADIGGKEVSGGSVVELRRVRIGVLPIPIGWVVDRERLHSVGLGGDRPASWIWPNGKKPFSLANVQHSEGVIRATLVPQ